MSSQALQIGGGSANPGFVQQGQVDWVAFANSTISASISVMQRFSAAGVQPVTVAGGLALGSRFELGHKGAQKMDVALKDLSGVFGYDKLLYYGFGYRSFVNILTETKVGVNLVALCACLVDMHGVHITADVLAALWKLEAFPEQFEPAISQFNALATACAGVVAATTFGQIGDIMLGDLRKLIPGKSIITGLPMGSISNADDIAKALHGLFQISRNTLEYIEVVGGANCSFIGAFAHWLLDLTVHVEDDAGTPIHQNTLDREKAQVRIRYCSLDRPSTELHIASTTYVLGNHYEMLIHTPWEDELSLLVRTSWDGCLERVYWSSIRRLKSLSRILGEFLGSAARIFAALARGEADVGDFSREDFAEFVDGTYGHGFVKSVEKIFPELGRLNDLGSVMLEASNTPFRQALSNLQMAIDSLMRLCECGICKSLTSRRHTDTRDALEDTNCILVTTMTITSLVRLVAGLERNDKISPTIAGLQQFYRQCLGRLELSWRTNGSPPAVQDALGLLVNRNDLSRTPHHSLTPAYLMADVQCLFTGCRPTEDEIQRNNYRTAFSYNGVCCYLEALRGLSSNAAVLRRIHVRPGRIQRGDREYTTVWDCAPAPQSQLPTATLEIKSVAVPSESRHDRIDVKALVTEVAGGGQLIFYYQAMFQGARVRIRPGMFTQRVLEHSGLITCDKRTCNRDLVFPCRVIREGWDIEEHWKTSGQPTDCLIWPFRGDDLGRCVAIEMAPDNAFYVRQGECLPCCTKAISNQPLAMII
jgi:hypothetical protein